MCVAAVLGLDILVVLVDFLHIHDISKTNGLRLYYSKVCPPCSHCLDFEMLELGALQVSTLMFCGQIHFGSIL